MTGTRLRVLILGGYGTFGGRLAELLSSEPQLTLVIAGRSRAKAEAFCAELPTRASNEAAAIDRDAELAQRLAEIAPDIVVDASGPFQSYGEDPYRVVKAALAAGVAYMDLADGSDFVRNIAQFDAGAKSARTFVLSGVSSFPVLTAAVVRHLAASLASVDSIAAGIAPSPYAGVGRNVIRAIAGYAGQPVRLRRGGRTSTGYPLFGFPAADDDTDVRITFDRANGVETWRRDFGTQRLTSNQYEGRGRYERLLCERFGPFVFGMALVVGEGRLSFVVRRWSFLGVALPRRLAPRSRSFEFEAEGRFRFHVEIVVPFVGPIVNYSGYLMQVRKGSGSFDRIKRPA